MSKLSRLKKTFTWGGFALGLTAGLIAATNIAAAASPSPAPATFSLQVSPSPLVATIKPGSSTDLELKIRNQGTGTEYLQIAPREFTVDQKTGKVTLKDNAPAEISDWISFSKSTFTVDPGQVVTEKIHVALPQDAGFSYSFALYINRANGGVKAKPGSAAYNGSVAVFTLINVDRPGATRKFDVTDFSATQPIFEYLPASFNITFKNTGNTIIQPSGNVFIQHGNDDAKPIDTLPVNTSQGYLLPGNPRILQTSWDNGFPAYKSVATATDEQKSELTWDWSKLTDFRIGQYTAKLVAIYNDGHSDIPVIRVITFWVIPWRAILVLILIIAIAAFIIYKLIQRNTKRAVKKALSNHGKNKS